MNNIVSVGPMSNQKFLESHARAGRVGLAGGALAVDRLIRHAQRLQDAERRASLWSHAFFFQGERADGHHWVIESDLEIHRKHIRLGAQENRATKYFNEKMFPSLAVLDFGLSDEQATVLVREGLEMVASHAQYSLRELVGAVVGLRIPSRRGKPNLLARDQAFYCSAIVQHLFGKINVDLVPGVDVKRNTPEDIFRSPVPHTTYLLARHK